VILTSAPNTMSAKAKPADVKARVLSVFMREKVQRGSAVSQQLSAVSRQLTTDRCQLIADDSMKPKVRNNTVAPLAAIIA
jgi:hypothetical protein